MGIQGTFSAAVYSAAEVERHNCEVAFVFRISQTNRQIRDTYLASVAEKRGIESAVRLRKDLQDGEVAFVLRITYPDAGKVAAYLERARQFRGEVATEKLRKELRAAWARRVAAEKQAQELEMCA